MDNKILFYEKQKFTQIWLWVLLIAVFVYPAFEIITKKGVSELFAFSMLFYFTILSIIILLLTICKLETWIDEKEIRIQFFPFHRKSKTYILSEISKMEIVKYNPIFDFGGWGIRFGGMNTMAYNTKGNIGLIIHLKDKKKVLIGTQKKIELEKIIKNIQLINHKNE